MVWADPDYGKKYYRRNIVKANAYAANYVKEDPARYLWQAAKGRAKKRGLAFTIRQTDIVIPATCPVLGIPLAFAFGARRPLPGSPTLDRHDNARGYTPDNTRVISHRANLMKGDATTEELEALVRYMRS